MYFYAITEIVKAGTAMAKRRRGRASSRVGGGSGDGAYLGQKADLAGGNASPLGADIEVPSWDANAGTPSVSFTGAGKYDFIVDMDGITTGAASGTIGVKLRNDTDGVDVVSKATSWRAENGSGNKVVHKTTRFEAELVDGKNYSLVASGSSGLSSYSYYYSYAVAKVLSYSRGESAYEIAVRHGFVGTEAEWVTSLGGTFTIG